MSRRRLSLDDLLAVNAAGGDVAAALGVDMTPETDLAAQLRGLPPLSEEERSYRDYGVYADYQFRTTPDDIRAEVLEMALARCRPNENRAVHALVHGSRVPEGLSGQDLTRLERLVHACQREVVASLSKRPGRKKPVTKMSPSRWEGPCSEVVIRTRHGEMWSGGRTLTEADAAEVLATIPT